MRMIPTRDPWQAKKKEFEFFCDRNECSANPRLGFRFDFLAWTNNAAHAAYAQCIDVKVNFAKFRTDDDNGWE